MKTKEAIVEAMTALRDIRNAGTLNDAIAIDCALDLLADALTYLPVEIGTGVASAQVYKIATILSRPEWIVRESLDEAIDDLCERAA